MSMNQKLKKKSRWGAKALCLLLAWALATPGLGLQQDAPTFADAATWATVGNIGANNNTALFKAGTLVDGAYGHFSAVDVGVLKNAGVDLTTVKFNEQSIQTAAFALADESLLKETQGVPAKRLANEYITLNASSTVETKAEAKKLLDLLVARQAANLSGAFDLGDYAVYSNLPAYDLLGRAGAMESINGSKAIGYILSQRDETTKAWPSGYVDFMSTAQAVRALSYLKLSTTATAIEKEAAGAAITDALVWIQSTQLDDGSFSSGSYDDAMMDAAEAVNLFKCVGVNPETIKKASKSVADYFKEKALNASDMPSGAKKGTFGNSGNYADATWALDAYVLMGAQNSTTESALGVDELVAHQNMDELSAYALSQNRAAFLGGAPVSGKWGELSPYDGYIMSTAGLNLSSLVINGKSFEALVLDMAKESQSKELKSNAKRLAGEYLFLKAVNSDKAAAMLEILKARQLRNGGALDTGDYTEYGNLAAYDLLEASGALGSMNADAAITYILSQQDPTTHAWPKSYPDFMATNQAVRALNNLKTLSANQALKDSAQVAIEAAMPWIKACQQADGSFANGSFDDPAVDTAEAIKTFKKLGVDVTSVKSGNKSGADYLLGSALNADGTFGSSKNLADNTAVLEACTLMNNGPVVTTNTAGSGNSGVPTGGTGTTGSTGTPSGTNGTGSGAVTPAVNQDITVNISILGKNKESLFNGSVTLSDQDQWKKTAMGALAKSGVPMVLSTNETNFVTSIGGVANKGMNGWMYKVNGLAPTVLAADYPVTAGSSVTWWYSTSEDVMAGSTGGAGSTANAANPTTLITPEAVPAGALKASGLVSLLPADLHTPGDQQLAEALNLAKGGKPVLSLELLKANMANLSAKNLLTLGQGQLSMNLVNKGVNLSVPAIVLAKWGTAKDALDTVRLGIAPIAAEQEGIYQNAPDVKNGRLTSLGGHLFELTAEAQHQDTAGLLHTNHITQMDEPAKVEIDLSTLKLSEAEAKTLTGVRYLKLDDGTFETVALGGTYDADAKTFSFLTEQFGSYGVAKAKSLTQLNLKVGDKSYSINGKRFEFDQAPVIRDNRTYVPIGNISKALGGRAVWNGKKHTATVEMGGTSRVFVFTNQGAAKGADALVLNGRTYVSLASLTRDFKMRALWIPSTKSVLVVK